MESDRKRQVESDRKKTGRYKESQEEQGKSRHSESQAVTGKARSDKEAKKGKRKQIRDKESQEAIG